MRCLCCHKPNLSIEQGNCPRCGFILFNTVGYSEDKKAVIDSLVDEHCQNFLKTYDVGITAYYWKDQDGTIVLDHSSRISLGSAASMFKKTVWLDQDFARMPDGEDLNLELSLQHGTEAPRTISVRIPELKEKELQRLGIELNQDLQLKVTVKNQSSSSSSEPVALLAD